MAADRRDREREERDHEDDIRRYKKRTSHEEEEAEKKRRRQEPKKTQHASTPSSSSSSSTTTTFHRPQVVFRDDAHQANSKSRVPNRGTGQRWERFDLSHAFTADELELPSPSQTSAQLSALDVASVRQKQAEHEKRRLAVLAALEDESSESIQEHVSRVPTNLLHITSKREADDSHFAAIFGWAGGGADVLRTVKDRAYVYEDEEPVVASASSSTITMQNGFACVATAAPTQPPQESEAAASSIVSSALVSSGGWKQKRKQMLEKMQ